MDAIKETAFLVDLERRAGVPEAHAKRKATRKKQRRLVRRIVPF